MAQTILKTIKESVNYWWLLLLIGLILIATGIWIFASPAAAYVSLSILFGVSILIIGIFETAFAISARGSIEGWGWMLASGVLDLIIGIYLLMYPVVTMAILPFILGFWLMFRGFSAFGFAFDMKSYGSKDWGWLLLLAIAIIFFGFMVLAVPAFGVANIIVWTGLSFIAAGVYRVVLAFKLRKLKKTLS
jgi:uncharacterized membrane protein HdeD (DUF308 family)